MSEFTSAKATKQIEIRAPLEENPLYMNIMT